MYVKYHITLKKVPIADVKIILTLPTKEINKTKQKNKGGLG